MSRPYRTTYDGGMKPSDLRLKVVPTSHSPVKGAEFDAVLAFESGLEGSGDERLEHAALVPALRGNSVLPFGPETHIPAQLIWPTRLGLPQTTSPEIPRQETERPPTEWLERRYSPNGGAGFAPGHRVEESGEPHSVFLYSSTAEVYSNRIEPALPDRSASTGGQYRSVYRVSFTPRGSLDAMSP